MGLFDRFSTLLRSNINDLISRAEDPEKMLNQILVDMRSQLVKAKQQVAAAIADEKRLRDQADTEMKQAKDWENKAMLAVREGRDDLAKQALVRKSEHESHGMQLATTWEAHRAETEKLKDQLRGLNDKIEEAKRKKNILIARKKRAEAQQQIANTMQGLGDTSAFDTFDRMAERIQLMEAEAEAGAELAGELSGDTLESKFLQLEQGGAGSEDDALAELKAKMGMLEAPKGENAKQLSAGAGHGKDDGKESKSSVSETGSSLTPEDLKELEDLDLSELDKKS
jgi:phage shock protein A